jgi:hypothetical protein
LLIELIKIAFGRATGASPSGKHGGAFEFLPCHPVF